MIIDGHQHLDDLEAQLAGMGDAGLDRIVLFSRVAHPRSLKEFEAEMALRQRMLADGYERAGRQHRDAARELQLAVDADPGRLTGFGWVPLGLDEQSTAAWIEREVVGRGFVGIGELRFAGGQAGLLEAVFRAAAAFGGLPVWIHGFTPLTQRDLDESLDIAQRHPDVPIIVGHLGGFHWAHVIERLKGIRHGYLDLTAAIMTFQLRFAIAELPERALFGSDVPYGDPVVVRHAIERSSCDRAAVALVLGENLGRLLDGGVTAASAGRVGR